MCSGFRLIKYQTGKCRPSFPSNFTTFRAAPSPASRPQPLTLTRLCPPQVRAAIVGGRGQPAFYTQTQFEPQTANPDYYPVDGAVTYDSPYSAPVEYA
jgi:hypothetical protein